MSDFHWFLPTYGDGRNIVNMKASEGGIADGGGNALRARLRRSDPYYLTQLARAAEQAGFLGVLLPTGLASEDTFITTAIVSQQTRSLEFIVAFRTGMTLPSIVAQMTGTLQRASGNRIRLNITTGGSVSDQRGYGDFFEHDERYERTSEWLELFEKYYGGSEFTYAGKHYQAALERPIDFGSRPPVYFAGSSEIAKDIAARQADVYLMYGEPPPVIAERVKEMRERAAVYGRTLRFGIFMHVITRDTEAEAFAEAQRHLDSMDPATIAKTQASLAEMDSVGMARMRALHRGQFGGVADLLIHPNVWAGVGLVRGGGGTALLGSHAQVAERIDEYVDAGLDTIILNGYPALEEAYRVGELVLPLVSSRRTASAAGNGVDGAAHSSETFSVPVPVPVPVPAAG
ncbi:MAG: hypothetical protein JWM93_1598 [Frankiales bacterium]|nr:hypothetical protein [Frankiales bacterium]